MGVLCVRSSIRLQNGATTFIKDSNWNFKPSLFSPSHGLRPFFGSHARSSHVQIQVRTHMCAHLQFKVVALRTRTFYKLTFFFTIFQQCFNNFQWKLLEGKRVSPDGLTRWSSPINQFQNILLCFRRLFPLLQHRFLFQNVLFLF